MTSATFTSAATCPSYHNSATLSPSEWPACGSSITGCQTQASYDAGLGWTWDSTNSRCLYSYGVNGILNSDATKADGTKYLASSTQDLTLYTNQGDCLANGFAWDNWLPVTGTSLVTGPGSVTCVGGTNAGAVCTTASQCPGGTCNGDLAGLPTDAKIRRLDALTQVEDGGGEFYSGTGAICEKCHSDQSRAYMERYKPGYPKTRHKLAGDALGEPFQPQFTEAGSAWGLQGVQCAMCHSTAKPPQDDLIQVVPAGVVGPPAAGAPKSASGHNQTEYGTHLIDICYTCHGTPATPLATHPASVIPVSAGDFALTAKGLAPIANQFLNGPHAKYTGSSTKVDVGDKTKYTSSFEGYVCRTAASTISTAYNGNVTFTSGTCGSIIALASTAGWWGTPPGATSNGCYWTQATCVAAGNTWNTTYDPAMYLYGASYSPNGVCSGVGLGSIVTTVYQSGVAKKIHNLDSTTNLDCTNFGGVSPSSGASAFWLKDGETSPGGIPADTAQGNCMTCHDVHWAMADTDAEAEPFRRECTTCHENSGPSASGAPQIDLAVINHLKSTGTPLVNWLTDPDEACEICHMPASSATGSLMHLWRINTDSTYTTMGTTAANLTAGTTAWVDLDHACGQCHFAPNAPDKGPLRTKAELAAVAKGMHVAAAPVSYAVTFYASVSGLHINATAQVNCGDGVPCPHFAYDWDWGDGTTHGIVSPVTHDYLAGGSKKIKLTVSLTTCAGGTNVGALCTVASECPGSTCGGGGVVGSVTRNVTVKSPDLPPTASATCTWDANTWTARVTDTSTDGDFTPVQTVTVSWGDSSFRSLGGPGAILPHTYSAPATSPAIVLTAIDTALKASAPLTVTCSSCDGGTNAGASCTVTSQCPGGTCTTTPPVAPAYFTISGRVFATDGLTPLIGASVTVKKGASIVKKVYTVAASAGPPVVVPAGTFSAISLKPGTYTLTIAKPGYTFAFPAATITVGPSSSGNNISATAP
jgi:hypothetical protein